MPVTRFVDITPDHPVDELPLDVAAALSPSERAALADVPGTFWRLARDCALPSLAQVLAGCAGAPYYGLELHSYGVDDALKAYFEFSLPGHFLWVRMPNPSASLGELPALLQQVYRSVGGVRVSEFPMAGGLWAPEDVCAMTSLPWTVRGQTEFEPKDCLMFTDDGAGDMRGVHLPSGTGVYFDHENGRVERAGDLRKVLDADFAGWLG